MFIWLAFWKRCWTADRLQSRGMLHPSACMLCDESEETIDHILIACVFARETWFRALSWLGMERLTPTPMDASFQGWWRRANRRAATEERRGLNSLVMLVAWELWKQRNRCVFDAAKPCVQTVLQQIKDEAKAWAAAGAKRLRQLLP